MYIRYDPILARFEQGAIFHSLPEGAGQLTHTRTRNMPIKIVDKLEDVPEAQRGSSIKVEGGKFAYEEVLGDGGKAAIEKERALRETAEKEAKDAKKLLDKLQKEQDAKDKGVTTDQLEEIRKKEAEERKPIEEERDRLKAENQKLKLVDRVRALALGKEGGAMEDRIDDLMMALGLGEGMDLAKARVGLTSDEKGLIFKDKAGNITTQTPEQFFGEHKKEKGWFYRGSNGAGGGSEGSQGGGSTDDGAEVARKAGKEAADRTKAEKTQAGLALK